MELTRREASKLITLGIGLGIAVYAIPYIVRCKDCVCYKDYADALHKYAGKNNGGKK